MPKCTINGKEIEVAEGTSIIEAFMQLEENIAHYCWHPGLSIAGVCRMCMVSVEGNPRLQIACNTQVTEGMVITNQSDKVKEAVEWTLGFHLINHPLDCPICDQAGECGLQEYYMQYGKYDPGMAEKKVKKSKVVDLGPTVVLDSERCILCDRCVRFTTEVSKTNELGIFNRGDHSEVGTVEGKKLDNNYTLNTVDICPVGALTSKDFRFKQRVWYLKDFDTLCNGCSTGCNIKAYYNENGFYRVKPNPNPDVNGYWMCDKGRELYKFVNREKRLTSAVQNSKGELKQVSAMNARNKVKELLNAQSPNTVAFVLTGQYTLEEYEALIPHIKEYGSTEVYHWVNNPDEINDFDGLLLRGDKNPNTKGLQKTLEANGVQVQNWKDLNGKIASGAVQTVVVLGPEVQEFYPDFNEVAEMVSKSQNSIWLTSCKSPALVSMTWQVPMRSYVEKSGTFVNFEGREQKFKAGPTVVPESISVIDFVNPEEVTSAPSQNVALGVQV